MWCILLEERTLKRISSHLGQFTCHEQKTLSHGKQKMGINLPIGRQLAFYPFLLLLRNYFARAPCFILSQHRLRQVIFFPLKIVLGYFLRSYLENTNLQQKSCSANWSTEVMWVYTSRALLTKQKDAFGCIMGNVRSSVFEAPSRSQNTLLLKLSFWP